MILHEAKCRLNASNKETPTVMIETGAKQVETEEKKANSQIAAV